MKRDGIAEHNQRLKQQLAANETHDEFDEEPDPEHARALDKAKWTLVKGMGILAAAIILWNLIPTYPFEEPPKHVKLKEIKEVERDGGIFMEGAVFNGTHERVNKVIYQIRYPNGSRTEVEYVVFTGLEPNETRTFSQRTAFLTRLPSSREVLPLHFEK